MRALLIAVCAAVATLTSREAVGQASAPMSPADAAAIGRALAQARAEGVEMPDAGPAVAGVSSSDPAAREAADSALSALAIALAGAEHGTRIDPESVDRDFALRASYDAGADFAAARKDGRIADWVSHLAPNSTAYAALVAARTRYAEIVAAGGWPTVPAGPTLKPGGRDPRTLALARRLAIEGYRVPAPAARISSPPPPPDQYGPGLASALKAFQADHGLKADGVLSSATVAAPNVSAQDRLAAIDANLERERWLPHQLPSDRIEVDVGGPQATLFQGGAPALTMRAIAGQPTKRTPTFASKVVAIEFNPPWIVPADIAARELYPKERRSPGYFARNDFYVSSGRLIQRAGPKSALGYLKFEIPDRFDVYLHDTPARSLFDRDKRWLSHGCVRLENPRDLAAALLAPQGWDRSAVDDGVSAGATVSVPLKIQTPVFVVYRTVVADAAGQAVFRPDVYGWDAELTAALATRRH